MSEKISVSTAFYRSVKKNLHTIYTTLNGIRLVDYAGRTEAKDTVAYFAQVYTDFPESEMISKTTLANVISAVTELFHATQTDKINPDISCLRLAAIDIIRSFNTHAPDIKPSENQVTRKGLALIIQNSQKTFAGNSVTHAKEHRSGQGKHPIQPGTFRKAEVKRRTQDDNDDRFKPPSGWQGR